MHSHTLIILLGEKMPKPKKKWMNQNLKMTKNAFARNQKNPSISLIAGEHTFYIYNESCLHSSIKI